MKAKRKRSWWRCDAPVTHREYGHGVITNFILCKKGNANVYFYEGECNREIPRYDLKSAGKDWHDHQHKTS